MHTLPTDCQMIETILLLRLLALTQTGFALGDESFNPPAMHAERLDKVIGSFKFVTLVFFLYTRLGTIIKG